MITLRKYIQINSVFSAFSKEWEDDYQFVGERHNFWEILYVSGGCAGVLKEDKVYELNEGEMIFYKPMEFHRFWVEKKQKLQTITISFSMNGMGGAKLGEGVFRPDEEAVALLIEALEAACYSNNYDDDIKNQMISNSLERLILRLLSKTAEPLKKRKTIGNNNYRNVIHIMNENINKKLTLEDFATLSNLSVSNLKKTFRKFSGMGVIEYFNRLKITEALKLLEENITITEISETLGFSSPGYFCDVFRKQCGRSPMEYRKAYKDSEWYFINDSHNE